MPEPSRFAQNLMNRPRRAYVIAAPAASASLSLKNRFFRLPHECEDARMTGMTRSLDRRLLALNVSGSLLRHDVLAHSRIA
jgi:hypothetical protein